MTIKLQIIIGQPTIIMFAYGKSYYNVVSTIAKTIIVFTVRGCNNYSQNTQPFLSHSLY